MLTLLLCAEVPVEATEGEGGAASSSSLAPLENLSFSEIVRLTLVDEFALSFLAGS